MKYESIKNVFSDLYKHKKEFNEEFGLKSKEDEAIVPYSPGKLICTDLGYTIMIIERRYTHALGYEYTALVDGELQEWLTHSVIESQDPGANTLGMLYNSDVAEEFKGRNLYISKHIDVHYDEKKPFGWADKFKEYIK